MQTGKGKFYNREMPTILQFKLKMFEIGITFGHLNLQLHLDDFIQTIIREII